MFGEPVSSQRVLTVSPVVCCPREPTVPRPAGSRGTGRSRPELSPLPGGSRGVAQTKAPAVAGQCRIYQTLA